MRVPGKQMPSHFNSGFLAIPERHDAGTYEPNIPLSVLLQLIIYWKNIT